MQLLIFLAMPCILPNTAKSTPKTDVERIKGRLKMAQAHAQGQIQ